MLWWILTIVIALLAFLFGILSGFRFAYDEVTSGRVFKWRNRDFVGRPAQAGDYAGAKPRSPSHGLSCPGSCCGHG